MKCHVVTVDDHGTKYQALKFCCPGCAEMHNNSGLHVLPVNSPHYRITWDWDGNLETPTVSPSILTGGGSDKVCHSFLRNGVFEFLTDSTHSLAGKSAPMLDLPDWAWNRAD